MSDSPCLIGLYWPARMESLDECIARCLDSLLALQKHGYETFFLKGRSRKKALERRLELTPEAVRERLLSGRNRTDIGKEVIPNLGFSMSAWSGNNDDEAYEMSVRCGGCSTWVGNSLVVTLPRSGRYSLAQSKDNALSVFRSLVQIWQPRDAVVCEVSELRWVEGRLAPDFAALAPYSQEKGFCGASRS